MTTTAAHAAPASGHQRLSWPFIIAGFFSLLASAYFDNIKGPLLPKMSSALGLTFTDSGWFLATSYAAAASATLLTMHLLNRWTERHVLTAAACVGLGAAVLAPFVDTIPRLMLLAALAGAAVSLLGAMANVLIVEGTPDHLKGRLLAALHSMFGIGSMSAAAGVGIAVGRGASWSDLYHVLWPALAALALFAQLKVVPRAHVPVRAMQQTWLTPLQWLAVAVLALYAAGEMLVSVWMTSFLVGVRGVSVSDAAPYLTAYYGVLTLCRLACAVWLKPAYEKIVLWGCLVVAIGGFAAGYRGLTWALALTGMFGPFFPVFLARISRVFPDRWRALTLWTIVCINIMTGALNIALGSIADLLGVQLAYLIPPLILLAALALLMFYLANERHYADGRLQA